MPQSVPSSEKQRLKQPPNQRQKATPPPPIPKSAAQAAAAVKAAVARTSAAKKQPQPQQSLVKGAALGLGSTPLVQQQQQQQQQQLQRRQRASGPSAFAKPAITCRSDNATMKAKSTATKSKGGSTLSFGASTALWLKTDSRRRRLDKKRRRMPAGAESIQSVGIAPEPTASAAEAATTAADTDRPPADGGSSLRLPVPRRRLSLATYPPPNSLCRMDPQRCLTQVGNNSATSEVKDADNAPSTTNTAPQAVNAEKGAINPNARTSTKQPAKEAEAEANAEQQVSEEEISNENDGPAVTAYEQNPIKNLCRRLRSTLNPCFRTAKLETIENNMHLIKLRKHPTQLYIESQNLMENGISKSEQILNRRRVDTYLDTMISKKPEKTKNGEGDEGANCIDPTNYPEWVTFRLRFKRENANKLWYAFVLRRKAKASQKEAEAPALKSTDNYNEKYIDVWTRTLTVLARPVGRLQDIVGPAFIRLGLENRADFQVNVGSFPGDKRAGSKIKFEDQLSPMTPVKFLYERGLTELFITPWPGLLKILPPGYTTKISLESREQKKGKASKKAKKDNKARNQSNERLIRSYVKASQLAATMLSLSESAFEMPRESYENE